MKPEPRIREPPTKKRILNGTTLLGAFVLGMLGLVFITIGLQTNNPAPIVIWTVFATIFFGVLFLTRKSKRLTVAFPDQSPRLPGARPSLAVRSCEHCERMIPATSMICPHCGKKPW